jgi:hypothetical protein
MRPPLPGWYLAELEACAAAAGVDSDLLLLAQCEGDVRALGYGLSADDTLGDEPACSAYVAFGPATPDGSMRVGRNFDYWGLDSVDRCALVTYVTPAPGDGIPFVAVGWTGILGGWTLVNERGLVVANHLGGGFETNPVGIPTLVMTRIVAQKAATVDEAIEILRRGPRMRGQIVWLAQPADPASGRPARAAAVEYDAGRVFVREATDGVLVVTNRNMVFGGVAEPAGYWDRGSVLAEGVKTHMGAPPGGIIRLSATAITLHSVEVFPEARRLYVAHGSDPAHEGPYVKHALEWPR